MDNVNFPATDILINSIHYYQGRIKPIATASLPKKKKHDSSDRKE